MNQTSDIERDRLQLEDLVKHDKINVERLDKKLQEVKTEVETIKGQKKREEESARDMAVQLEDKQKEAERMKKQS